MVLQIEKHEDVGNLTAHHLEMAERFRRKHNIVVMGLWIESNDEEEIKNELYQFFKSAFQMDVAINNVTKVNDLYFNVRLVRLQDKSTILKNRYKLRNMGQKINIFADWTDKEKQIAQKIGQRAQLERMKGHNVRMGYMRLYIDNNKWVWNHEKDDLVCVGQALYRTQNK